MTPERDKLVCVMLHPFHLRDARRAPHPFRSGEIIGCPVCGSLHMVTGCDEPGCGESAVAFRDGDPFRNTCREHRPTA